MIVSRAQTAIGGQVAVWLMGLMIFFDDYANTLVVGNTARPITDQLNISREKLAYIVDSTAAPVVCIALITTWIGYEVSLIDEALQGIDELAGRACLLGLPAVDPVQLLPDPRDRLRLHGGGYGSRHGADVHGRSARPQR